MLQKFILWTVLSVVAITGCSADKKADAAQPDKGKPGNVPPRPSVVSTPSSPYVAITVADGVRLTGTIDFDGEIPRDSVIDLPPDMIGCGNRIAEARVESTGTRIGGVIVWITDIRTGRALPLARRFEIANEECLLTPRVQAVVAPSTINFVSGDAALHHNRIINVGTGELEGVVPFNDNGEVVPLDRLLDKTEELEITCDRHPWAKAWILAFDHPYFATTDKGGAFAIDDVPPGAYHVKAWHPLLGVAEQTLNVVAGQPASLALRLIKAATDGADNPQTSQTGKS